MVVPQPMALLPDTSPPIIEIRSRVLARPKFGAYDRAVCPCDITVSRYGGYHHAHHILYR
jgi:hypothetical protein